MKTVDKSELNLFEQPTPSETNLTFTPSLAQPVNELVKFLKGFVYAYRGIVYTFRTQRNMQVHLGLGLLATGLGLWLGISLTEWAILVVTMALVFCLEMVNTAVEKTVDLVTDQYHPLAKIAKDVAAGAVLMAAILSVVVGLILFAPRLLAVLAGFIR